MWIVILSGAFVVITMSFIIYIHQVLEDEWPTQAATGQASSKARKQTGDILADQFANLLARFRRQIARGAVERN
jgi:hypothetical protein